MKFLKKHKNKIILILVFTIGISLRLFFLDKDDLWRDEAFSVNAASGSFESLIRILINDSHPPIHLIILFFVIKLFGNSEIIVRLPSVLFGIGTLFIVYKIAKQFLVKKTQVYISILFIALNPILIIQSRESRPYSLFLLFFSLSLFYFLKIIHQKNNKNYLLFILFSVLACYTHYFGLIILIIFNILLIKNKKFEIKLTLLSGIGITPLLSLLIYQYSNISGSGSWLIFRPIQDLIYNSYWIIVGEGYSSSYLVYILQLITIGMFLYSLIITIKNYQSLDKMKVVFDFNVGGKLLIWLLSFITPLFYVRYLSFFAVTVGLLVAKSTGFMQEKARILFISIVLLALSLIAIYNTTQYFYPDYKSAINFVSNNNFIHLSPESFHSFNYYNSDGKILGERSQYEYYQGTAALSEDNFTKVLPNTFYLIIDSETNNNELNYSFLDSEGYKLYEEKSFRGIIVEQWKKTN